MKILCAIVIIAIFLMVWNFIENHIFTVHSYEIKEEKLPNAFDQVKIMYLADIHNTSYGKYNKRLKKAILKQKPDYVMIGGDMLSRSDVTFDHAIDLLCFLAEHYPVYFSNGNHETRMKNHPEMYHNTYQDFRAMAKGLSVTFLNNEKCLLKRQGEKGTEQIVLHGLELPEEYFKKRKQMILEDKEVTKYLGKCLKKEYHIVLAHSPNYYDAYDEWGADLVLSGHNHGGMVRIPFVGGVLSTQAKFFPEYSKGLYYGKNGKMIVSAGMGSHTIKVRFFNPPEIVMIALRKEHC